MTQLTPGEIRPADQLILKPGEDFRLTILGEPRQKKNSRRLFVGRNGKPGIMQNELYAEWLATARFVPGLPHLLAWKHESWWRLSREQKKKIARPPPLLAPGPVNLRAVFFRVRNVGDLDGYVAGLQDLLTRKGVWADDRLVRSLDGCRLAKDPANPRVELVLTALEAA